ncbi:MATE family efflux transporter [Porphyromonadaceae bacterium W3.11]|nr:MATE family efflux transporter [Porphyromonadaceae bacterium W3.11]
MSKAREVKNLTTGHIGGHITRLAIPILGTSLLQLLYSFTDMAWLGRLSGESVAAAGAASVFIWLANSFSLVNKVGSEVTVANAIGRGELDDAATYASHTSTIAFIMGVGMMLIYGLLAGPLIGFYQLEPHIHQMGVEYLRIAALGMPLIFMMVSYTGTYNASGHSKIPFIISTIGLVLNMVLDPIFIFLLDLGIKGAACATVLSQAIGLTLFLIQILKRDKLLGGIQIFTKLQGKISSTILKLGMPVAIMNSLFALINMALGRIASQFGGYIGVMTLTTGGQLEGICWNTAQGFSTALSSFVSQNFGAGKRDRIISAFRFTLKLALGVGLFGFFFYFFWGESLFRLIVPEEAAYKAGATYLKIQAIAQIFSMLEITSQGFFYGIRRTLPPSLISMVGNLLRIPFALILLPIFSDIIVLWWIISISSILKGAVAFAWYFRERKRLRQEMLAEAISTNNQ